MAREGGQTKALVEAKLAATPLVAGGVVVSITNTLVQFFDVPADITALVLSFFASTVTLVDAQIRNIVIRFVSFTLNALTVFSVAAGMNTAAMAVASSAVGPPDQVEREKTRDLGPETPAEADSRFFQPWFGR